MRYFLKLVTLIPLFFIGLQMTANASSESVLVDVGSASGAVVAKGEAPKKVSIEHPVQFMKNVVNPLLAVFNKNPEKLNNLVFVKNTINQLIVPYVDVTSMTRSILGRKYWSEAKKNQKKMIVQGITDLVVNTYATAVEKFDDDKFVFSPIRGGYKNKSLFRVRGKVVRKDNSKFDMTYTLRRINGSWRILDFTIEHISMVASFKQQLAPDLKRYKLAGLIKSLQTHNHKFDGA